MPLTRQQLRHEVANQLDDLYLGVCTARVGFPVGVADQITVPEFVAAQNEWEGHEVAVYAGAGVGQARLVQSSGDRDGTLVTLPWGPAPVGGSVEGHKRHTTDQYNRALNAAIRAARGAYLDLEDTSLVQDADQSEYAIPAGLIWLATVETEISPGVWSALPRDALCGYSATIGRLTIPFPSDGQALRLRGMGRPLPMTADTDLAPIEETYLIDQACSLLDASLVRAPALDRLAAAQAAAYWQTLAAGQLRKSGLQNMIRVAPGE